MFYPPNRVFKHFWRTLHICLAIVVLSGGMIGFGCHQLSSDGVIDFSSQSLAIQTNSSIQVFSYKSGFPEYITDLSASGDAVVIPNSILIPQLNFGVPSNPLISVNRTNSDKPVPVDMILKIYNSSETSKDFYFEIPVLGTPLKPSNISTALSWILRWSGGSGTGPLWISKNQFDRWVEKVQVICVACGARPTSELVQFILQNDDLTGAILTDIRASNPTMPISTLSYQPPAVDYAWSFPTVARNWQILTSVQSPTTRLVIDVALVNPSQSAVKVKPISWRHSATLDQVPDVSVNLAAVPDTPLIFIPDSFSNGTHRFEADYTGNIVQPFTVLVSVLGPETSPFCRGTGPILGRANKLLTTNLNKTIIPAVMDASGNTISRITTTRAATNLNLIASGDHSVKYVVSFLSGDSAHPFFLKAEKQDLISNELSTVLPAAPYFSGRPLVLDGFTLFVSGTPVIGDRVEFTADLRNLREASGCMDPDPSNERAMSFAKMSGPPGLIIANNGTISWIPSAQDYDSSNPTKLTPVVVSVTDSHGQTQQFVTQIQVTADQLPQLCLTANLDTGAGRCPTGQQPTQLPAPPKTGYNETQVTNERLALSDLDGDPLRITARAVNDANAGSLPLVSDTNTKLNVFTATLVNWFNIDSQKPSLLELVWQFVPNALQVTGSATGTLRVVFDVSYDTTLDPTLSGDVITTFEIPVVINNIVEAPTRVASTAASCGTSRCNASNQDAYLPSYFVIGDTTPNGPLVNPRTKLNILVGANVVTNPLREGEPATIQLPVIAKSIGSAEVMYSISNATATCSFLRDGRVKIAPSYCAGSESIKPDCLTLSLNYSAFSDSTEPIPTATPLSCSFTLTAHDRQYPSAKTSLGNYTLLIQDVNLPVALRPSPPLNLESVDGGADYPVEGLPYDIKPFIDKVYSDLDLGAKNGQDPAPLTTQTTTEANGSSTSYELIKFNASAWAPELKFSIDSVPSGTTLTLQDSADQISWNNMEGTARREEGGGLIVALTHSQFIGTIAFQQFNAASSAWTNLPNASVRNIKTNTLSSTLTRANSAAPSLDGRYFVAVSSSAQFRIRVTAFTSGTVSATTIGNYSLTGTASMLNQDLLSLAAINTSVPSALTTMREFTAPTLTAGGTYYVKLRGGAPYFRIVSTSTSPLTARTKLPTITVLNTYNVDPRENAYAWKCWLVNQGASGAETYSDCTAHAPGSQDSDTNLFFAPNWPTDLTTNSMWWTPPYSAAADGNLQSNSQRTKSWTVQLRLIDKGYYPSLSGVLPTLPCGGSGPSALSCVDYRFPVTVIESAAKPTVTLLDSVNNIIPGARWRDQSPNGGPTIPTFTVNEGSSVSFSMKVEPYSNHAVDNIRFGIRQTECKTAGVDCPRRPVGSMLLEPTNLRGDFSQTTPKGGAIAFAFRISPNASEGNGPDYAESVVYSYRYEVAQLDESGNFISGTSQIVGFNAKVVNINHNPETINFASDAPGDSGYLCKIGDSICDLNSFASVISINRTTQPTTDVFTVPLVVKDADLLASGLPSDNLQISVDPASGFNNAKVQLQNTTVGGQPYTYLRVSITGPGCASGNTTSPLSIPLVGTDNRTGTVVARRTVTVLALKVSNMTCL